MFTMRSKKHIRYKTAANTAYQKPWWYVSCGLIGGVYMSIATVMPTRMAPEAAHIIIDPGSAMMYRTRFVKLHSRKTLPTQPVISDTVFSV